MVKLHFLFIALALLFGSSRAIAQTFTTLYRFTAATATNNIINNDDGANPTAGLLLSGHTLYGTTFNGGTNGAGVIFSINTDGTDYTNLRPLSYDDGAFPQSGLILLSNRLCGTTFTYGRAFNDASFGFGSVFTMNTDGTDYTVLYRFSGLDMGSTDGGYPYDYLILSGNTLFGTTVLGGSAGDGVVYKVNTDGTGYTNLHDFVGGSDGWNVESGLVLAGNTLYGTTAQGGTFDCGTIYAVNTDGTGYTNLYTFTGSSDGAYPYDRLILSSNILYGVAIYGGVNSNGTVFAINTDGTGFTILHDFTSLNDKTNADGAHPFTSLVISGNILYGTSNEGGSLGWGTVFAINTDGTGFTNLYSFTGGNGGNWPNTMILSDGILYGTTQGGGNSGLGTIFSLSLAPNLGITMQSNQLMLSWPAWAPNFHLQTATNLAASVWVSVLWPQVSVDGQNTVTCPISGSQQFYRLVQ